jgi:hypothetical protein
LAIQGAITRVAFSAIAEELRAQIEILRRVIAEG